jgi:hypothetical protein
MFTVDRRKTLIFMNERTLLSFIIVGAKKSNCSDLRRPFLDGLEQLLLLEEIPVADIERVIKEYASIGYAKTDSRSTIGNMNDLVYLYKYTILDKGGFTSCDVGKVIYNMNRRPQWKLDLGSSVEALRETFGA